MEITFHAESSAGIKKVIITEEPSYSFEDEQFYYRLQKFTTILDALYGGDPHREFGEGMRIFLPPVRQGIVRFEGDRLSAFKGGDFVGVAREVPREEFHLNTIPALYLRQGLRSKWLDKWVIKNILTNYDLEGQLAKITSFKDSLLESIGKQELERTINCYRILLNTKKAEVGLGDAPSPEHTYRQVIGQEPQLLPTEGIENELRELFPKRGNLTDLLISWEREQQHTMLSAEEMVEKFPEVYDQLKHTFLERVQFPDEYQKVVEDILHIRPHVKVIQRDIPYSVIMMGRNKVSHDTGPFSLFASSWRERYVTQKLEYGSEIGIRYDTKRTIHEFTDLVLHEVFAHAVQFGIIAYNLKNADIPIENSILSPYTPWAAMAESLAICMREIIWDDQSELEADAHISYLYRMLRNVVKHNVVYHHMNKPMTDEQIVTYLQEHYHREDVAATIARQITDKDTGTVRSIMYITQYGIALNEVREAIKDSRYGRNTVVQTLYSLYGIPSKFSFKNYLEITRGQSL